jgi:hypothetical protein
MVSNALSLKDETFLNRFALKLFFVTIPMRQAAFEGKIDYIEGYKAAFI